MAEKETVMLETKVLGEAYDYLAPDTSEIRLMANASRGNMAHCTLPVGGISKATRHKTIEELWYFVSGKGRMWRKLGGCEELIDVGPGVSVNNPTGTAFQFRNTGDEPLCFIVVSMPPWPGMEEAIPEIGPWEVDAGE